MEKIVRDKLQPEIHRWINLTNIDLSELRILWFLYPDKSHTKSIIASKLHYWDFQVLEALNRLRRIGLIYDEYIPFGVNLIEKRGKIRVYQLSEIGRFFLNQMDTQFPGLFVRLTSDS